MSRVVQLCLVLVKSHFMYILILYYQVRGVIYVFFLLHSCIVWVISLPCPPPTPFFPSPPWFQAGPVLPLWLILLKKRHKYSKKDKVFLLVELRIAIQKYSYYCSEDQKSYILPHMWTLDLGQMQQCCRTRITRKGESTHRRYKTR
jgi:hypothetical protein